MLCVHKGHLAAPLLGLRDHVQSQGGLAGGLRPVDLHNPPRGQAADAQGHVQGQRAGGDVIHVQLRLVAEAHNGALAVHPLDLGHGRVDGPLLIVRRSRVGQRRFLSRHCILLLILYKNSLFQLICKSLTSLRESPAEGSKQHPSIHDHRAAARQRLPDRVPILRRITGRACFNRCKKVRSPLWPPWKGLTPYTPYNAAWASA